MKGKRGLEFSFAWIFALFVGAIILFLAIYAAVNITSRERHRLDTFTAKEMSIIFEPMETGMAEGKKNIAHLREVTKINNYCYNRSFGSQGFSVATRQGVGEEWQRPGEEIEVKNKYVFSGSKIKTGETKELYFFSKPLKLPWKVAPLIFMTTDRYCFIDPPREIENDIEGLALPNVRVDNQGGQNCSSSEIEVCFSGQCNIEVGVLNEELDYGVVKKKEGALYYTGNLVYGAIFSDKEVYECNVDRLMYRLRKEANLYKDESNFLTGRCDAMRGTGFISMVSKARAVKNSRQLNIVAEEARKVDEQNYGAECRLW